MRIFSNTVLAMTFVVGLCNFSMAQSKPQISGTYYVFDGYAPIIEAAKKAAAKVNEERDEVVIEIVATQRGNEIVSNDGRNVITFDTNAPVRNFSRTWAQP